MASKQEEIREGIVQIIDDWHGVVPSTRIAEFITQRLHSQGVVVRVDRELPQHLMEGQIAYDKETYQEMLKRAGYEATEPLIEADNGKT